MINLDGSNNLLKSALIYGANSAGKSNLIKAIDFMKGMVVNSHTFNVNLLGSVGCIFQGTLINLYFL